MITCKLYNELYGKDIHFESFPTPENYETTEFNTADIEQLNSEIWKQKKDNGLSLKAEVKEALLPEKFKPIERDLISAHNIAKIAYGKEIKIAF